MRSERINLDAAEFLLEECMERICGYSPHRQPDGTGPYAWEQQLRYTGEAMLRIAASLFAFYNNAEEGGPPLPDELVEWCHDPDVERDAPFPKPISRWVHDTIAEEGSRYGERRYPTKAPAKGNSLQLGAVEYALDRAMAEIVDYHEHLQDDEDWQDHFLCLAEFCVRIGLRMYKGFSRRAEAGRFAIDNAIVDWSKLNRRDRLDDLGTGPVYNDPYGDTPRPVYTWIDPVFIADIDTTPPKKDDDDDDDDDDNDRDDEGGSGTGSTGSAESQLKPKKKGGSGRR